MAGFRTSGVGNSKVRKPPVVVSPKLSKNTVGKDLAVFVSPTEPAVLHALGTVALLPEEHGVDIIDLGSRTGIQRKTVTDLYASMHDGRLAKQISQRQSSELVINYVLLLEGTPFGLDSPLTEAQTSMALLTIQRAGYYYMQSRNLTHTATLIPQIFKHFRSDDHNLINRPPSIQSDWRLTFLQLLPGVGSVKAKRLLDEVGFPFVLENREKVRKIVGESSYAKIEGYLGI